MGASRRLAPHPRSSVPPSAPRSSPPSPAAGVSLVCEALSTPLVIHAPPGAAAEALAFQYAHLRLPAAPALAPDGTTAGLRVEVAALAAGEETFSVRIDGDAPFRVRGLGDLLHQLDNALACRLQLRRPSLYFVHAACLARGGSASIIAGESGAGKSTTAYALASRGLDYLSDELAPIEPATNAVFPYPRAICLKNKPPAPLRLPARSLSTDWTLHVDAADLGAPIRSPPAAGGAPAVLERIVFLGAAAPGAVGGRGGASLRRLSPGEAALRLYQNALNQLAHAACGLDDTLAIVARSQCYELLRAGVEETLRALKEAGVA